MAQVVNNLPANAGDLGLIPGAGTSPRGRNGNPLQYSCLGSPMGRGAWQAIVHGVIKSQTRHSDNNMLSQGLEGANVTDRIQKLLSKRQEFPSFKD